MGEMTLMELYEELNMVDAHITGMESNPFRGSIEEEILTKFKEARNKLIEAIEAKKAEAHGS